MKKKYINPFSDYNFWKMLGKGLQESDLEEQQYEDSLRYERDLKKATDAAREEGRMEGRMEGREEGKEAQLRETVRTLLANGFAVEAIAAGLSLPGDVVRRLLEP